MPLARALLFAFGTLSLPVVAVREACADELTPELETLELRHKAEAEAKKLTTGLAALDQRRLTGLYVAFDTNPSDASAMVACDDDGDYVIVLTDAMLRLLSSVARAQSSDEADAGRHHIDDYADFLGRSQRIGTRLLPPPPGFFTAENGGTTHETRLREALAFVLARELAHLRAGDLVCAHPTATHESGDDVWTSRERQQALASATFVYPGRASERDTEATSRVLDAGRSEQGALGLLRFFARAGGFSSTYASQHPNAPARAAAVTAAARDRRSE